MTRLPLFSVLCLASALLVQTNPSQKSGYLDAATTLVQETCCRQGAVALVCDRAQPSLTCGSFRPLARQMVRQVLNFYTPAPRNYLLFTVYRTELPEGNIHALGIAGHHLFWPLSPELSQACQSLI
ncbi:DUF4359 domain-containing protein [Nodosilinea sp. P-1105]|uniref:DUF4359 domain-containing protein n=1 Tax=Nodosilinea sp. P-1105 TaxID=2546229 RepID=UPI00146B9C92|nr:DUF4359 domain-containing protein [Nodosilinea sp. P-1105]NMF83953.1 DUF4359 domain-containing protein [Nodosilinea sp. P-1105]